MARHELLLRELTAYLPSDPGEAGHRQEMLQLLLAGEASFARGHFGPGHFTASLYVIDDAGRLLLHHHRRLNLWLQMGGHIDSGEPTAAAALREGREESGLTDLALVNDGIFDLDVHLVPAGKGEPDHRHFDVRYLGRTGQPDAIRFDPAESNDLVWVSLDEAQTLMKGPEAARVINKIAALTGVESIR